MPAEPTARRLLCHHDLHHSIMIVTLVLKLLDYTIDEKGIDHGINRYTTLQNHR